MTYSITCLFLSIDLLIIPDSAKCFVKLFNYIYVFFSTYSRHNIKDDVRQSLYDAANEWMSVVSQKGTPFLGGKKPNLADISVYGSLSSIEGCKAFQDLRDHTDIGKWFDNMKQTILESRGRVMMASN